jgi:hypothetical protein
MPVLCEMGSLKGLSVEAAMQSRDEFPAVFRGPFSPNLRKITMNIHLPDDIYVPVAK